MVRGKNIQTIVLGGIRFQEIAENPTFLSYIIGYKEPPP